MCVHAINGRVVCRGATETDEPVFAQHARARASLSGVVWFADDDDDDEDDDDGGLVCCWC